MREMRLILYKETDKHITPSHHKRLNQDNSSSKSSSILHNHLQDKMKSSLVILLIGTIFAMTYAAPSMAMEDGDDKVAKTARWLGIARRVVGGLNAALNGEEELALNQMEDEDDDNLLSQALLDRVQERAELEQEVTTNSDDDDDDGEKAAAQFHLHFHFG